MFINWLDTSVFITSSFNDQTFPTKAAVTDVDLNKCCFHKLNSTNVFLQIELNKCCFHMLNSTNIFLQNELNKCCFQVLNLTNVASTFSTQQMLLPHVGASHKENESIARAPMNMPVFLTSEIKKSIRTSISKNISTSFASHLQMI